MLSFGWRLAYDTLNSECVRLREQNDRLLDMVWRLSRKEAGLSEVQPEQRPTGDNWNPPPNVRKAIGHWENPDIQARREASAKACWRQTKDWNAVLEVLALPQAEEDE